MVSADEVLEGLDPEQRRVAASPVGPMCVLAGAGTGKTRAITHRIAYGVHAGAYDARRVMALTFTARAAGEMRSRLRRLGLPVVQARTFHSAALRQLHYFWPKAVGGPAPEVLSAKAPVVAEAAGRLHLQLDRTVLRDLASEIEWAKVSMLTPDTYRAAAARAHREPAELDHTAMARLFEAYEEVKTRRGVIDFEDVLTLTVAILSDRDDVAAQVHDQYRHFVVDEYQDVNKVQQALLDLWVGDRADLCVVGDPAQTIYSFTGASPRHLLEFARRHPGADTVSLVRNYRSSPQIISLANRVLAAGPRSAHSVQLRAQRDDGPEPRLTSYGDDDAEAAGIAQSVAALLADGVAASEIAILYRINAQSETIEQALSAAGIPYLVCGGERFFRRKEVRDAIVLLRGAVRSDDGTVPLGKLVRDVITPAGWSVQRPAGGATLERWQSLDALAGLADDFAGGEGATLRDFLAELERRAAEQHAPTVEGVTLASMHAAKGLEWDAVLIAGCSDGLLPISMAQGADEIEEERRLFYVALTRARRHLHLSWAAARNPDGRQSRRPSRFLDAAAPVLGDGARSRPKSKSTQKRGRAKVVRCRGCGELLQTAAERKIGRCSQCPPTYDEQQFESLRSWRLEVAAGQKVPAFVVFTDATLIAIAEKRPTAPGELAKVSGVGARKLASYGQSVIDVLHGADPAEAAKECLASMAGPPTR